MKKFVTTTILVAFLLSGCVAMQVIPERNTSLEIKTIVLTNEATMDSSGGKVLVLEAEADGWAYKTMIFIRNQTVLVEYMLQTNQYVVHGTMLDKDGNGSVDDWYTLVNNVKIEVSSEDIQEYYDNSFLKFVRYVSKNGTLNRGEAA